jgi:hypothetical protein
VIDERALLKRVRKRVLGHTQANTACRYVNANVDTWRRVAAALDAFNDETEATQQSPELVN